MYTLLIVIFIKLYEKINTLAVLFIFILKYTFSFLNYLEYQIYKFLYIYKVHEDLKVV